MIVLRVLAVFERYVRISRDYPTITGTRDSRPEIILDFYRGLTVITKVISAYKFTFNARSPFILERFLRRRS